MNIPEGKGKCLDINVFSSHISYFFKKYLLGIFNRSNIKMSPKCIKLCIYDKCHTGKSM